jgi:TolB protein
MHPTFAPDGRRLAYCCYSARQDRWELWVVNLSNTAEKSLIGFGLFPVWSPQKDKDVIAFQRARQRGSRWFSIWTCELVANEARKQTEIVSSTEWAAVGPVFSPDGKQIAFTTVDRASVDRGGTQVRGEDIWIVGIDGFGRMQLTSSSDADWSPAWGPDGRIYFCSDRGGRPNIWSVKPMDTPLPEGGPRLTDMGPTAAPREVAAAPAALAVVP